MGSVRIGVQVGDEDRRDAEPCAEPHHLPLGALAAVEEHEVTMPLDS